jgi:hypothetical protein
VEMRGTALLRNVRKLPRVSTDHMSEDGVFDGAERSGKSSRGFPAIHLQLTYRTPVRRTSFCIAELPRAV